MKHSFIFLLFFACSMPLCAQWQKQFSGSLVLRTDREFEMEMKLRKQGDILTGTYYYVENGSSMNVQGVLAGSNLILEESDQQGVVTGLFKGIYKLDSGIIRGRWFTTDQRKSYYFELKEEDWTDYRIVEKHERHNRKVGSLQISSEHDFIEMRAHPNQEQQKAFNQFVKDRKNRFVTATDQRGASENCNEIEEGQNIFCTFKNNFFICVGVFSSTSRCSTTQFNMMQEFVFDLQNKRALELKDLFKHGFEKELQLLVNQRIREMEREDEADYDHFCIKDDELSEEFFKNFYFQENEMMFLPRKSAPASEKADMDDIAVSYQSLKNILKPGSVLTLWLKEKGKI